MQIDFPGTMTGFAAVQPGDFFVYFDDQGSALGMKIYDSSKKTVAVVSFSVAGHPSVTPPTVLEEFQFQNRSVCVVPSAVSRPPFDLNDLRSNSPSLDRPGPIIVGVGGTFIRAYGRSGTIDVDLNTGAAEQSRAHAGSVWIDNWEIVLPSAEGGSHRLCERGKPASQQA